MKDIVFKQSGPDNECHGDECQITGDLYDSKLEALTSEMLLDRSNRTLVLEAFEHIPEEITDLFDNADLEDIQGFIYLHYKEDNSNLIDSDCSVIAETIFEKIIYPELNPSDFNQNVMKVIGKYVADTVVNYFTELAEQKL